MLGYDFGNVSAQTQFLFTSSCGVPSFLIRDQCLLFFTYTYFNGEKCVLVSDLEFNGAFAAYEVYDFWQVTQPIGASFSSSVKWKWWHCSLGCYENYWDNTLNSFYIVAVQHTVAIINLITGPSKLGSASREVDFSRFRSRHLGFSLTPTPTPGLVGTKRSTQIVRHGELTMVLFTVLPLSKNASYLTWHIQVIWGPHSPE